MKAAGRDGRYAVMVLCLVQFVDVLGVTVVVTALPEMLEALRAAPSGASLVATGYATFFGGLLMFGARVGDRVGHRRAIVASMMVFAVGNVVAALATSLVMLAAARCVQGAAAAGAVPSALRLLTSLAGNDAARARAISAWSASGAAAGASGFVAGGVVTDLASWRDIYWALLAIAAVLAVAVLRAVPADGHGDRSRPVNAASSAMLTAAVMAVVAGATLVAEPVHRWVGAGLLCAAALIAATLHRSDRRSRAPLLPSALLAQATLRRGAIGGCLNTATTGSVFTLLTLYLQDTIGRSPLAAAAALVPFSVAVVVGSGLATPLLTRLRRERVAASGLAAIAVGDALLIAAAGHVAATVVCTTLAGLGIGLSSVATTSLGTDVAEADRATTSGIINTTAQLGTAIGVAALLLVAAATTGIPSRHTPAPAIAWAAAALLAIAGAVIFATLRPLGSPEADRGSGALTGKPTHGRPTG